MKKKNPAFRKVFYAACSENYNPYNDLLYLEAFEAPDWYDLQLSIEKNGYLDLHEMYRAHYRLATDIAYNITYWDRRERDLTFLPEEL